MSARKMYAHVTKEGTARSETAVCSLCTTEAILTIGYIDCTENEALQCVRCGWSWDANRYYFYLDDECEEELHVNVTEEGIILDVVKEGEVIRTASLDIHQLDELTLLGDEEEQ